jgi:hypothetical protein
MPIAYRATLAQTLSRSRQPPALGCHERRETAMTSVPTAMPALAKPPPQIVMRWGAVSAGLAVGLAVHLLLMILGAAAGFSALGGVDAGDAGLMSSDAGPMSVAAGTWNIIAILGAAFCGGYVAARTSGLSRAADGVLYGLVAWGVTTLLFAALASDAVETVAGGLFGQLRREAGSAMQTPVPGASTQELSPPRMPGLELAPRQHWQRYRLIRARSNAIADIEEQLKLPFERAARIVDDMIAADAVRMVQMQEQRDAELRARAPLLPGERFLQRSQAGPGEPLAESPPSLADPAPPPPSSVQPPVTPQRDAAGPVREAVNVAIWWLFAATAGSLLAAVLGGALGAYGTRRRQPRLAGIPAAVV